MPQLRARVAQLLAERAQAARLAQEKTADAQHQAAVETIQRAYRATAHKRALPVASNVQLLAPQGSNGR